MLNDYYSLQHEIAKHNILVDDKVARLLKMLYFLYMHNYPLMSIYFIMPVLKEKQSYWWQFPSAVKLLFFISKHAFYYFSVINLPVLHLSDSGTIFYNK